MEFIGRRRVLGALALGLAATLAGCGSGHSNNGPAQVRLVNASPGYTALDFYLDSNTTASISNVATGAASDYISVPNGAHASTLDPHGTTTVAQSQSRTFSADVSYTILALGWQGALYTFQIAEDEPAPDSGQAKVQVLNAAIDAGPVDVYLTGANDSLAVTTPDNGDTPIDVNKFGGFVEHPAGTYRVRVTRTGDKNDADVLLDIPSVTLSDQQITTLVLVPTAGGVLVNAVQMDQKSKVTAHNNPLGRVRLVNALATGSATTATVAGTTMASMPAHTVGTYTAITASSQAAITLTANGVPLAVPNQAIAAGGDYTLLVYGDPAAPQFTVLTDDNRLPTIANKANVRLVNGLNAPGTPLSLIENSKMYVSGVLPGAASSYESLDSSSNNTSVEFDVDSASQTLFTQTKILPPNGVFTVWLMGDASAPIGTLLSDR